MAERRALSLRPTGMRKPALVGMLVIPLVLAGCGDQTSSEPRGRSTTPACRDAAAGAAAVDVLALDLDGDGTPETVRYVPATPTCPALLVTTVQGRVATSTLDDDIPVTPSGAVAIRIPGRVGDVAVVRQEHPRGGFQARLFGYADGELAELTAGGKPVFDFIATDVLTSPTAAQCVSNGFEVTEAKAHEPIGIVPAWEVYRTPYTVDGITVTKGATTEVADNVLDAQLRSKYSDLVNYSLFEDCAVRQP